MNMNIQQLQQELTRALDFHYPKHWEQWERDNHDERIKRLEKELEAARLAEEEEEAFERWHEEVVAKESKLTEPAHGQLKGTDTIISMDDLDWFEF